MGLRAPDSESFSGARGYKLPVVSCWSDEGDRCGYNTVRALMRDIGHTLLRENLTLTFEQRARKHLRVLQMV